MENPFQYIARYNLSSIKSVIQIGASGGQEIHIFHSNDVEFAVMKGPLEYPLSP